MRPLDCQTCYRAAERNAVLVVTLRRVAQKLHNALGHASVNWLDCPEPQCASTKRTLEERS